MKIILLLTFTISAVTQLCTGAVIPKPENNSLEGITDSAFDLMGQAFMLLPTANKEKVGILTNVLKKISKNLTSEEQIECGSELLYLAISNENSTLTLSEWKKVINDSIEEQKANGTSSSSSEEKSSSSEGFTEEDSKLLEEKLSRIVTPVEVKRIITSLKGFRNDATSAETNAAMFNLVVSAMVNTLGMQPDDVKDIFNALQNESSNESSAEKNTI